MEEKKMKWKEIVCNSEHIKKGKVTNEEAIEFVKTLKCSKYSIVEQL